MAIAGWRFDVVAALAISPLIVALLVCTGTDLLRYRVPNVVTYPGTGLALLAALIVPGADTVGSLLAALLAGSFFFILVLVTRGGIGLGDAKLAALVGAALGLPLAYQALLAGMIVAGIVLGALVVAGILGRRQAVPYAPFLALSALAFVLVEGPAYAPL
jgi:prepilin signal peptidase PulO-like enzyme (type II secretory pathway)